MDLLQMSFSGAVLILVIVVIRAVAIHRLPKRTFLALWIIVLLRLLVPFSVPSPVSIYSLVRISEPDFQISDTVVYENQQPMYQVPVEEEIQSSPVVSNTPQKIQTATSESLPSVPSPSEPVRTSSVSIWTVLWSIGVLVLAGSFSVSYLKCRREFRTSLPIENDIIKEWLDGHQLKRKMEIRQFSGIMTPMTYGLFHPIILLPENTDWENKQQLQYILYHEYVHIRNYDAALKILAAAALCIHWFNPMVWVMHILFNRDIELTCDESVVYKFGSENRSAYAKMLISMEERKSRFSPFFNNFSKTAIEERITSIMKTKKTSVLALILSCVVVVGTAGCFATSVQEDKNDTEQTESNQDVETASNDPYGYPASEEWSFEKICSLVEIDGTPLKFPCTLDEFLSHNDNIKAEKLDDIYNYYDIYCNDKNVGLLSIKKDTEISDYMRCDYYNNEEDEYINEMTFAGYTVEQESEINKFLDENFNVSYERSSPLVGSFYQRGYIFEQNNKILEFTVCFENSKLCLVIIKLDEIETLPESVQEPADEYDWQHAYAEYIDRTGYQGLYIDDINGDGIPEAVIDMNTLGYTIILYYTDNGLNELELTTMSSWGSVSYIADTKQILHCPWHGHTWGTFGYEEYYLYDWTGTEYTVSASIFREAGAYVDIPDYHVEEYGQAYINGVEVDNDTFETKLAEFKELEQNNSYFPAVNIQDENFESYVKEKLPDFKMPESRLTA